MPIFIVAWREMISGLSGETLFGSKLSSVCLARWTYESHACYCRSIISAAVRPMSLNSPFSVIFVLI